MSAAFTREERSDERGGAVDVVRGEGYRQEMRGTVPTPPMASDLVLLRT